MGTDGGIRAIPVDKIRPFQGQPRRYFDPQALRELANSIARQGQYTPAWVTPADAEGVHELVAGERRWRACGLAGVKTLLCEVRAYATVSERYVASVMENFGRKDCTVMETARSVGLLLREQGNDRKKVASIFARSEVWVQQMNSLNRLVPEVQAMLEPPAAVLTTQTGVMLSNLLPEVQTRLAREIATRQLKHRAALSLVRASVKDDDRASRRGRRRKPSDDFEILKRFLDALGPQAQVIMELGGERIRAMFAHRAARDKELIRGVLRKRVRQLEELEGLLE